jgi:hypothetical protein
MNRLIAVLAAVVLAGAASTSFAQNAPPPGGAGGQGGQGGRGGNRRDPAQMRQQMNDRMKELLGATDDEWKLLQPQIEKVQTLQRTTTSRVGASLLYGNGNNNNGGGGRGFRGGQQPDNATPSAVEEKARELTAAIQNKDTKPDEYKSKMAAYREARTQAKADLSKAQESLREVVTVRQEAVLVDLGLLD